MPWGGVEELTVRGYAMRPFTRHNDRVPQLTIRVESVMTEWGPYRDLRLVLQTKHGLEDPTRIFEDSDSYRTLEFAVPFKMSAQGGHPHPVGDAIQRANDGGRFVYLQWWGVRDGRAETFRRLKVPFVQILNFGDGSSDVEITVRGKDPRGGPACATAVRV